VVAVALAGIYLAQDLLYRLVLTPSPSVGEERQLPTEPTVYFLQ
jgi:hypothetical protein